MAKHCKECGTPIYGGRQDRDYCGDACRHSYNNRLYKVRNDSIKAELDAKRNQACILDGLYQQDTCQLFQVKYLGLYGLDLQLAEYLELDLDNTVKRAVFGPYELVYELPNLLLLLKK